MIAIPSAPIKSRPSVNTQHYIGTNLSTAFDNEINLHFYYYKGDIQQHEVRTKNEMERIWKNPVYNETYGNMYEINNTYFFLCDDLTRLDEYTTFVVVDPNHMKQSETEHNTMKSNRILCNLVCYTEEQINTFSKPGLVLGFNL